MLFMVLQLHTKRIANKNAKDRNLALGSIQIAEQVETLQLKTLRTETWPSARFKSPSRWKPYN